MRFISVDYIQARNYKVTVRLRWLHARSTRRHGQWSLRHHGNWAVKTDNLLRGHLVSPWKPSHHCHLKLCRLIGHQSYLTQAFSFWEFLRNIKHPNSFILKFFLFNVVHNITLFIYLVGLLGKYRFYTILIITWTYYSC